MATDIVEQTTVLEKLNNCAKKRAEKKQIGVASILPYFKNMILSPSSEYGIDVSLVPVKHCSDLFEQNSGVRVQIHLPETLQSELKCTVDVTVSLATALYHGNFTWDQYDSPKNLCSLIIGKQPPFVASGAK